MKEVDSTCLAALFVVLVLPEFAHDHRVVNSVNVTCESAKLEPLRDSRVNG